MSDTATQQASDLVDIEIDGVAMQAPKGSMIIEAADKAGIVVPRFCYHKKLSIAANCRMCLVDVEKAPKPLPACATPVMDGMRVYTQSKRAQAAQQNVMEFLLINHPLDCPICDQGGECELQDLSMGYGRSVSRFSERKRVVKDEDLGPLISTDMTRCIHCTRCVRFLDELAGTNELGGMGRGENLSISTFIHRSIDSEISGNIIDLCPVGALTNKPFRFSARAWELRAHVVVANHDAVGSNLYLHSKRGRALRAVPKDNEGVNENWLADRDRWGWHGIQADDRALRCRIKSNGAWEDVDWGLALEQASQLLSSVAGTDLAWLLSSRASDEELYLGQKIARALGCANIDHRLRIKDFSDQAALPLYPGFEQTLATLDDIDSAFIVGSHITREAPLVGLKLRQAWRRGGKLYAINQRAHDAHFDWARQWITRPSAMVDSLAAVAKALGVDGDGLSAKLIAAAVVDKEVEGIAAGLKQGGKGILLFGHQAAQHAQAACLRKLASLIAAHLGLRWCELPDEANAAGAWRVGALPHRGPGGASAAAGLNAAQMLGQPSKVYLLYDFEPSLDTAWGNQALATLKQADAVIYVGAYASDEVLDLADVILPLAVAPEVEGSFTNLDGLTQRSTAACQPPGDARAGWKVLRVLGNELGLEGFDYTRIDEIAEEIGQVCEQAVLAPKAAELSSPPQAPPGLEVVAEIPIYSANAVLRRAGPLQQTGLAELGSISMHPDDADQRQLKDQSQVTVTAGKVSVCLALRLDGGLAKGSVRLPAAIQATAALAGATTVEVSA